MLLNLGKRFLTETDPILLWKFIYNFGWQGMRSVNRFKKRVRRGSGFFPAFLVISVTDNCNLNCRGCWVTPCNPTRELSPSQLNNIICECRSQGSSFFGILGGEPLLYKDLFEVIAKHPEAYFQIFTNGTLIDENTAATMRKLGNVTPLISIEGLAEVSDERRGGRNVYQRSLAGIELCRKQKLITGVATSVCRSNINELLSEKFLYELIERGILYVWYYIYRPVGKDPAPELALKTDEIIRLRRFIVEMRTKIPLIIVDAYWDHLGRALCPGAAGISHHIGPGGEIEFCPPLQFARENIGDASTLATTLAQSDFLRNFREFASSRTRGCVLLEMPDELHRFLEQQDANDSSGRNSAYNELATIKCCPGHHLPGKEIPEKHWAYRLAKKYWFFGFGAYG